MDIREPWKVKAGFSWGCMGGGAGLQGPTCGVQTQHPCFVALLGNEKRCWVKVFCNLEGAS